MCAREGDWRQAASIFLAASLREFVKRFGPKLFVNPPQGARYFQSDPPGLPRALREPSRTFQSLPVPEEPLLKRLKFRAVAHTHEKESCVLQIIRVLCPIPVETGLLCGPWKP